MKNPNAVANIEGLRGNVASGAARSRRLIAQHRIQVGDAWIATLLVEQRRDLATMMGLMIEDVGDGPPERDLVPLPTTDEDEGRGQETRE